MTGYSVYVRNAGSTYGTTPHWTGNPTPAADGSLSASVTFTPSASAVDYFAVAANATQGESGLSAEAALGSPNPCRVDSCTTKTSCTFANLADGTPCDDASFCNGPEVCLAGACDTSAVRDCSDSLACSVDTCDDAAAKCVHTVPAGCCFACDSADPCLADACAAGDCSAGPPTEIQVNRVRFLERASGIKLAAKGKFEGDPNLDPTRTGVVLEFHAPDGAVLYRAAIAAQSMKAGASGGRFRFTATRTESDFLGNGLTRLDLHHKGSNWIVTAQGETPELLEAFLEPTVTWVIKLGTTCTRRMDMACTQKPALSICH